MTEADAERIQPAFHAVVAGDVELLSPSSTPPLEPAISSAPGLLRGLTLHWRGL